MYIVKATIIESNPQLIREFSIDENETAGMLLNAVSVVYDWEIPNELKLISGSGPVSESTPLKELDFSQLTAEMPMAPPRNPRRNNIQQFWRIRLAKSGEDGGMENMKLLRFRGFIPDPEYDSMRACNKELLRFKEDDYYSYYHKRRKNELTVNERRIGERLSLLAQKAGEHS